MSFLFGILHLMRIPEWSKSFGNMAIAAIAASFLFGLQLDLLRFLLGFASLALLWSGLYALNDFTDRKADALHSVKRNRPIPSGMVPANIALLFAILLIAVAFALAFLINKNSLFLACLAAMFVNQIMYTTRPFSFKKRPVVDLISGSLVNPAFRFYAGWVLFVPAFNAPLSILLFILGIQFGGFGLYRMSSKEHEKSIGLNSSVVLFGERNLKKLAYVSLAIGAVAYIYAALTVLPISYLFLGLAMLLAGPLYKTALKKPQETDLKRMYRIIYIQYLAFIAGFILLYFLGI